jgi:recombination DNA repair RAD52 pathway protein
MKGGNFDESYIEDAYSENYKSNFYKINSRKEMADSPNFFLAFSKDNVNLFNEKSNNFYRNKTKNNANKIKNNANKINNTEVHREWKPEITVKCSLPNGELIKKTGKVYSEHQGSGFIIIYCE